MTGVRINLGSGDHPLPGFVNVDALPDAPGVDIVADISQPLPFRDGSADLLYASHLLEHFSHEEVPRLLADWRRVLRDGGVLLLAVPDLDVIARMLVEREGWFTPPHNPWLGAIYGGQKDEWDFHKTGFTNVWLAHLLSEAGFGAVRRVTRFIEVGAPDFSMSPIPFGVNVSLNLRAVAGVGGLPTELVTQSALELALDRVDWALRAAMSVSSSVRSRAMARRRRRLERALATDDPA
jgi:predicted SAM-dependent methyltransferase